MSTVDSGAFDVLTFDCYGTIIDWESGILAALRPILERHGVDAADEALLELYAGHETAIEAGPYRRYGDVLAAVARRIGDDLGFAPSPDEVRAFARSVGEWPPFEDSVPALEELRGRFKLAVITNCDDDLFAATQRRLGVGFDWVITAEQAGAYKPSHRPFELSFERIAAPRERILHVAQSLFHDHVPAKELGLTTVWVDRREGKSGTGATPPAAAAPDLTVPDLKTLAGLAT